MFLAGNSFNSRCPRPSLRAKSLVSFSITDQDGSACPAKGDLKKCCAQYSFSNYLFEAVIDWNLACGVCEKVVNE